jgi:hypothetical protein
VSTATHPRARSKVQQVAHWFGMEGLPRFSMKLSEGILLVARHDERIRVAVGKPLGEDRTHAILHLSLTERQARRIRDGLTHLLGDGEAS